MSSTSKNPRLSQVLKLQSESRIRALINLGQSEPEVTVSPSDFDADQWSLNCSNGTVDLRTGKRLPHDRANLITKVTSVPYDPDATCPIFETFLERIFEKNKRLINFMGRAIGYALTGDTSAQCLFIAYGTGANGKTTLFDTIGNMLGEYAKQAAPALLIKKHHESHPTGLADLFGARFVPVNEVGRGQAFDEELVKRLTGGDPIKARLMRQDFFEFVPTHKLFLAVNHKPDIGGADHAIWRRIHLIPFTVTIPEKEQDKELPVKLKAELPGILAWAVRGCLDWQQQGLAVPDEVMDATEVYRDETDRLLPFFEDECVLDPRARVSVKDLRGKYDAWCHRNNEEPLDGQAFPAALRERGFTPARTTRGRRIWKGIALWEDWEEDRK